MMVRRRWVIPLFLVLGFTCLAIGTWLFMKVGGHNWLEIAYTVAFEAAIIFFTATIIETLLVKEFGDRAIGTMERIGKDTFALIKNADYNGIIDILPPRFDSSKDQKGEVRGQLPRLRLRDALKKSKKAKILSITGGGYLTSIADGGFYEIFKIPAHNYPDG